MRNLQYGTHIAKQCGGDAMKVGCLADQFGHAAEMPAILRGFGIEHAVFARSPGREPPIPNVFT